MEIEITILIFIVIITSSFILSVFKKRDKRDHKQTLLLLVLNSQLLWTISILATLLFYDISSLNLWLSRSSYAAGSLIAIAFLMLSTSFEDKKKKPVFKVLLFAEIVWFILSFTSLLVKDVEVPRENILISHLGILQPFFSLTLALTFLYAFKNIYSASKNTLDINLKLQLRLILWGGITSLLLSFISNLVIPQLGVEIRSLGPIFLMIFVGATFYAITRHRFLKLNTALAEVVSFIINGLLPFAAFHLLYYFNTWLWGGIHTLPALIGGVGESFIFYLLIFKIQKEFNRFVNKHAKKDYMKISEYIDQYETDLGHELDREEVINKTSVLIVKLFSGDQYSIVEKNNGDSHILAGKPLKPAEYIGLNKVVSWISKHKKKVCDRADIKEVEPELYSMFLEFNIEAVFKVNTHNFIIIFTKKDLKTYDYSEIQIVKRISQIFSLGLQRSDLYEKQRKFGETLQIKVEEATKELQRKYQQERDMIGILGHELRTPLTIAKNNLDYLLMKIHTNKVPNMDYVYKKVESAYQSIETEARIVETALSTSHVDNNKIELMLSPVDIREVVEYGIKAHLVQAEKKGLKLYYKEIIGNLPKIITDQTKLQEIITNFISNAVKYTRAGYVKVFLTKENNYLLINVEDTGEGIPKDELSKVGQKFYRVQQYTDDKAHVVRPGGTGLGLYVAKAYLKAMGGEFRVTSEFGKGSTFTAVIPFNIADEFTTPSGLSPEQEDVDMFAQLGLKH